MKKSPVAIVTGSTKGIGRGIAETLAQSGHSVVITSRKAETSESMAQSLREKGFDAIGLSFNIENVTDIDSLIEKTVDHYGRLDTLVNNALSTSMVPNFQSLDAQNICFAITSNVSHTLLLIKNAYPYLKETAGNVINIGSIAVNRPILGMALYTTVKGAIVQMTRTLAAEWAGDNIRVNCINPGFVYSSALDELSLPKEFIDAAYKHCEQFHPLGNKIGEPIDVGQLAAYLASDAARMMTGSVIDIDGGLSIQGINIQPEIKE